MAEKVIDIGRVVGSRIYTNEKPESPLDGDIFIDTASNLYTYNAATNSWDYYISIKGDMGTGSLEGIYPAVGAGAVSFGTDVVLPYTYISLNNFMRYGDSYYATSGVTKVSAPNLTSISGTYFCYSCTAISEIDFPVLTEVTSTYCLAADTAITSANFPALVSVSNYFMYNDNALTEVSFPVLETVGTYFGYAWNKLETASFPVLITADNYSFYNLTALSEISLPVLKEVGTYCFYGCTSLTEISFPVLTDAGQYFFYGCTALTEISLPALERLDLYYSFYNTKLTKLALPSIITLSRSTTTSRTCPVVKLYIGKDLATVASSAFNGWSSLTDVYYEGSEEDKALISIISTNNSAFTDANWHYNVTLEQFESLKD